MAGHGTPIKSWDDQAAFREYVATRLDELVFAFSDHGLLAESIDASSAESRAFRGYIAMNVSALVKALDTADRPGRCPRRSANPRWPA
jgi:hypothetical protein